MFISRGPSSIYREPSSTYRGTLPIYRGFAFPWDPPPKEEFHPHTQVSIHIHKVLIHLKISSLMNGGASSTYNGSPPPNRYNLLFTKDFSPSTDGFIHIRGPSTNYIDSPSTDGYNRISNSSNRGRRNHNDCNISNRKSTANGSKFWCTKLVMSWRPSE